MSYNKPIKINLEEFSLKIKRDSDLLLENIKRVHMIGIGGSGMYPIAEILHSKGYSISGSDNNETDTLARVRNMGIPVTMGHFKENVLGAELVIYSAAIMQDNPELVSAREQGIPTMERSLALGAITRNYDNVIGVCGTHGKTTVSAMTTQILLENGFDPTAVIGGRLPLIDGNGRAGETENMVCESCEYVDTFLQLSPDICVILNIDNDHMEYFKTMDNMKKSYVKFASMAKTVIVNKDDKDTDDVIKQLSNEILTYGTTPDCDFYAKNIAYGTKNAGEYDLFYKNEFVSHIFVTVPGKHNISNSIAAAASAYLTGAKGEQIAKSIKNFKGAGRRFEILAEINSITIADDYAHHPKELEVTLESAMNMGYGRVIAVFQPFTYSRTKLLLDDFARVLSIPDITILSEIMGSREVNTIGIYSKDLAEKIDYCENYDTFEEIADRVVEIAKPNDLVITLGCGDIYKAAKIMIKKLTSKYAQN